MSWKTTMSRKTTFALLVLTMLFAAGANNSACLDLPGMQVAALVNNKLVTHLAASSSTIYTGQSVTFVATVTDEKPNDPFTAEQYEWSVGGTLMARTANAQIDMSFEVAGTYYVEVAVEGSRGPMSVTDYAGIYVTVEDNPDESASDDFF